MYPRRGIRFLLCGAFATVAIAAVRQPAERRLPNGIEIWRKPDAKGRACASCHSPDGIDIAAFDFDDATLLRRAYPHLGLSGAQSVVAYIHSLRSQYGLTHLLPPMDARPMQPGGQPLSGKTPSERDQAFALELRSSLPLLASGRVETLQEARQARDQLLALDLSRLKIGIPFNRLSEDAFHGKDHASIASWIPQVEPCKLDSSYIDAQTRYLRQPGTSSLLELDAKVASKPLGVLTAGQQIDMCKARSLLIFQDRLRRGPGAPNPEEIADRGPGPGQNPMWDLGDLCRIYSGITEHDLGLPQSVMRVKRGGPSLDDQIAQMKLPWMWLGWSFDQGLQRTSPDRATRRGDTLVAALLKDGPYPAHCAFFLTRKIAVESYVKQAWISPEPQHLSVNYSALLQSGNLERYSVPGPAGESYRTFLANAFRMCALLESEELGKSHTVYQRAPLLQQFEKMGAATARLDPGHPDSETFAGLLKQIRTATDATELK